MLTRHRLRPTGISSAAAWISILAALWCTDIYESAAEAHETTRARLLAAQKAARQREASAEQPRAEQSTRLTIELQDAATGRPIAGLVRVTDLDSGKPVQLDRIHRDHHWYVLHLGEGPVAVVPSRLKIEAFHGITTRLATREVDMRDRTSHSVTIPLQSFPHPVQAQWPKRVATAGNTHLHLMRLTHAEAVRYLDQVPEADGLDVVFLSVLRRLPDERHYISNDFTAADLQRLSQEGAVYGNGEEHRHNFGRGGEGFGHVMFLNLQQLVRPVSIGPGIMREGTDSQPLQTGIRKARDQQATVIWCHNTFGHEDLPNWAGGWLDAQNIFDGGPHGTYEDTFYRYLNLGMRVPFSTGTDWFIYDFSRVYVPLASDIPREKRVAAWLKNLRAGKSIITNGPLLSLHMDGATVGDELQLESPRTVQVTVRGAGRSNFGRVELIHNGRVIEHGSAVERDGHFGFEQTWDVAVDGPGWFAARIAPAQEGDEASQQRVNELQRELFAHTSPIYVRYGGRLRFEEAVARQLIREIRESRDFIEKQSTFADGQQRKAVLDVYDEGIRALETRMAESVE